MGLAGDVDEELRELVGAGGDRGSRGRPRPDPIASRSGAWWISMSAQDPDGTTIGASSFDSRSTV